MHRKCLKSTKTTEQACRPLHISYSLISLIQKVINDCSVALVEGVIDGGMVRVMKPSKRVGETSGPLGGLLNQNHPPERITDLESAFATLILP